MDDFFGIDFGTTNSATVSLSGENVITHYGDTTDRNEPYPSIVAIHKATGKVYALGREARDKREEFREDCEIITSVKSLLGSEKTWILGNRTWRPYEVAAEILRGLKEQIAHRTGKINDRLAATVAIPVGFSSKKRQALRLAAKRAGIDIMGFVAEPTAAVYNRFGSMRKWDKVAVFDWGGGTLDISVVEIKGNLVHERATSGFFLGGDDLDMTLAKWAHNEFLRKSAQLENDFDTMPADYRDDLIFKCERAKRLMLTEQVSEIITLYAAGVIVNLDNDTFMRLMMPVYDEVIKKLEDTIREAKCSLKEIGCILMVGGSSKILGLYQRLSDKFDCLVVPADKQSAEWDIASGAAKLNQRKGDYILSNDLGLLLSNNEFFPLLEKGQRISCKKATVEFGLIDDSDNARFVFAETRELSTGKTVTTNNRIGYLTVPAFGFTNETIKMQYEVDEDLVLKVSARSSNKSEYSENKWEYEKLNFVYSLPREI